jgi:broad specificity phosphatase PhoE
MEPQPGGQTASTALAVRPGALILARHGRPDVDRTVRIDWRGYVDWWAGYDLAGLADGQAPPDGLLEEVRGANVIFTSTLRRAIETAEAAGPGRSLQSDPIFVEAPLPPPRMPGRWKPGQWGVMARTSWWLGRSGGAESREDAEQRAIRAVERLVSEAEKGHTVALFAHGWFNRMMRPVLKASGWKEVYDGGDTYWSHRRFEKD